MDPGPKGTAPLPMVSPYSSGSSNQSCNSNMGGQTSFDQSFNRSNPMGPGSNPQGANSHMMFSQQQQQHQQQQMQRQQQQQQRQQHMQQFMNRMPSSDNDFGMFPDHMKGVSNPYGPPGHPGMNKMGMPGNPAGPPGNGPGMLLQHQQRQQQPQQQQFSYSQRMFGFGGEPTEQKKKRGRPRKNETREPGTKRQYKRKPKPQPGELPPQQQPQPCMVANMGGVMGQPPVGARIPGVGMPGGPGVRPPQQQMGSNVYNFEDEEGCPEPDNDRDGILDVNDQCPLVPEDRNGNQDSDE